MESVDTEYYNSLLWIKENDPAELDLTFQVTWLVVQYSILIKIFAEMRFEVGPRLHETCP